ncbi:hypothetical protein HN832_02925 [archaeon]|jgi:hypothetical protein|nr:hypothetical protein [archaeon]MBT4373309.1 hypothetical protein [archaeon]MBT4531654.1 hypothetical protein [archaeon]MBT7001168.1 hypothetical protein [archaeon]MBT7282346.1 hypothetical protein [archaeon]
MKRGLDFWDILAWLVLAGILVWLVLKVTGVINTPVLIQYAPYFGVVYLAGWQIHKLSSVAGEVESLKRFEKETVKQIHEIKTNCVGNHK